MRAVLRTFVLCASSAAALLSGGLARAQGVAAADGGASPSPGAAAGVEATEVVAPFPPDLVGLLDRSFASLSFHELDNGVRVALDPTDSTVVSIAVAVEVGVRDQPRGWSGLAHMAEHLHFHSRAGAPRHYLDTLEDLGAIHVNGVTGRDRTVFFETLPHARLRAALWLEAERFARVLEELDPLAIAEERLIVSRERAVRETSGSLAPSLTYVELYGDAHPYGRAVVETEGDLAAIDMPTMQSFLQQAYTPPRLSIAISGRFDPVETLSYLRETFGALRPAGPPLPLPEPVLPALDRTRRVRVEAPVPSDAMIVMWPSPAYGTEADAALDLVASVLRRRLVTALGARGLSVQVRQESAELASTFVISVAVPDRTAPSWTLETIDGVIATLSSEPVGEDEVERARRDALTGLVATHVRASSRAVSLARATRSFASGRYDPREDARRYVGLTAADVHAATRRYLVGDRRLLVEVEADPSAPLGGRRVTYVMIR